MSQEVGGDPEMTDVQKYQFDRQGFVVIEDALSDSEVEELNRLIEENTIETSEFMNTEGGKFHNFLKLGKPFCDLLDHERVAPVLREILGDGFRMDHYYGLSMSKGDTLTGLHNGLTPYRRLRTYHTHRGDMFAGMTVVAWNLRDAGPDYGGFCCLPGSHKSHYPCPDEIHDQVEDAGTPEELPDSVVIPEAPAGSVVIFPEALTHGTAPWVADHQRRSLLFQYNPGQYAAAEDYPEPPENVELTDRQKHILQAPHDGDRGVFDNHDY